MKNQTTFLLAATFATHIALSGCATTPRGSDYARLDPGVKPQRYEITLNPHVDNGDFEGTETITLTLEHATKEITIHAHELTIDEAKAGGLVAAVGHESPQEMVRLTFPATLAGPDIKLSIRWHGRLRGDSEGFYRTKDRGNWYAFTHFEPTYARRMFPCFDEPALKAVFKLSVEVNTGLTTVSNSPLLKRSPAGPGRELVEFKDSPKMSSYLVAFAEGPFTKVSDGHISIFMPKGREGLGDTALKSAQESVKFYNGYFGIKYPYAKLDLVACPNFSVGAMENTAAIFFTEASLMLNPAKASKNNRRGLFGIVAHEIAHQWFGDLVTMRWWDDLWLNEAFATFMASKASMAVHPEFEEDQEIASRLSGPMSRDSYASTHPVHSPVRSPGEAESQFDAITYIKGAASLRMLETYMGGENFRLGIHDYLKKHGYSNATGDDLWDAISKHAPIGRDARLFARRWFDTPGVPVVSAGLACDSRPAALNAAQERFFYDQTEAQKSSAAAWPIPVCLSGPRHGQPQCGALDAAQGKIELQGKCPAWVYPNAGAKGYFRTRLSPELRKALVSNLGKVAPTDRIAFWELDTWPEFYRGWLSSSDLFDVLDAEKGESSWRLWRSYAAMLDFMEYALVTDADRAAYEAYVEKVAKPVFERVQIAKAVEARTLKSVTFGLLGERTSSSAIREQAKRWLADYEKSPKTFDPELTDAVVRVNARFGDQALWSAYKERGLAQADPRDRMRYIVNLGAFRDPALIEKSLRLTLDTETLHDQERAILLNVLSQNPVARTAATVTHWTRDHWADYDRTLPHSFMRSVVMSIAGQACTKAELDEAVSFYSSSSHRPEGHDRVIDTILASSRKCVEVRDRETAVLARRLAKQN